MTKPYYEHIMQEICEDREYRYRLGLPFEVMVAVMSFQSYLEFRRSFPPWLYVDILGEPGSEIRFSGARIVWSRNVLSGFELYYTKEDLQKAHSLETLIGY